MEILAGFQRRHVERSGADDGPGGYVAGAIERQCALADPNLHLVLRGCEFPRQRLVDIRIEPDGHFPLQNRTGSRFGGLGGAAIAGDLTEHLVKRHSREGSADHAGGGEE